MSHILYLTPVDKTDPNISVRAPRRNSGRSSRHMAQPGPPDSDEAMVLQMLLTQIIFQYLYILS